MNDGREQLSTLVRAQAASIDAGQAAELHLLELAFRDRLSKLGVEVCPDIATTLMAIATLLGEHAPEWGGDVRSQLAEIALLGLQLLECDDAGP